MGEIGRRRSPIPERYKQPEAVGGRHQLDFLLVAQLGKSQEKNNSSDAQLPQCRHSPSPHWSSRNQGRPPPRPASPVKHWKSLLTYRVLLVTRFTCIKKTSQPLATIWVKEFRISTHDLYRPKRHMQFKSWTPNCLPIGKEDFY